MDCKQGPGIAAACDGSRRITTLYTDKTVVVAPEPFEVAVSEEMGIAATAHLYNATVALFDLGDARGSTPAMVDQRVGIFDFNANGARGAYGMTVRPIDAASLPATCEGLPGCTLGDFALLLATSRFSPRVAELVARGADQCRPTMAGDPCMGPPRQLSIAGGEQVRLDTYLIDGGDVRDISFTRDGRRAYVVERRPPSLVEIDTSPSPPPAGDPRGVVLRAVEVCGEPSLLMLREDPPPLRAYVTCFSDGQIFVVDPQRGATVDVIDVGRGPNGIVQLPRHPTLGALAAVVNFADNNLAFISLEPASPTENRVLFKIGAPRPITGQH
jgi:hypothetical protein